MLARTPALGAIGLFLGSLIYGCSGSGDGVSLSQSSTTGGDPPADAGPDAPAPGPDGGSEDGGPTPPKPDPSLKVFDPTKLHTIDIDVDPMYWTQLENDKVNRVPCKVTWNGDVIEDAGCRKKGGIGSVQPLSGKPGISIKFDSFKNGQALHGLEKIILNNAVQDNSFLNEHLGYEVYRRMGIPAARTAHGVMRLNGETKGIYVVAEAVSEQFLADNFGKGNDEGNLYEAPAWTDFVTEPMGLDLKDEVEEMRSRDDILAFSDLVQNEPDATFATAVKTMLDLDRFITGYAIDAIFYHWDGYSYIIVNNYYMYNNPGTKRFVFMPHGMDQLFEDLNFDINSWPGGRLSQRVRENPELDQQFKDEVVNVLKTAWDVPELIARIDQVEAVVNTNTNMDPAAMNDLASFKSNVESVRTAVAYRKSFLLGEPLNVCGNGAVEPTEDCDDANATTGDGCSSTCFNENCVMSSSGGKSYAFCADLHTAFEARLLCEGYKGTLVVPESAIENEWLRSTAQGVANQAYWIGIDDEANDGTFVKPDGSKATYLAWAPGQPSGNTSQNCVIMDPNGAGWNDKACSEVHGVICALP
ncbi:MAG TPA: CotH kinase family protein [Polyangiaceae bacterium]|nr:CotH kinase family protein [Polyangiaceae bacterium]